MTMVLLVTGLVACLYAPWFQREVRQALVSAVNAKDGMTMSLDDLSIKFPLNIGFRGLSIVQNGDTTVSAKHFDADIALLPLLRGEVSVDDARLTDASYRLGSRDSATCITLRASDMHIAPANVKLSPMHIDLRHADLRGALVDIYINPTPPPSPKDTTQASPLSIDIGEVNFTDLSYRMNMMPTIDTLTTHFTKASVRGGNINLTAQTIRLDAFDADGADIAFITPGANDVVETDTTTDTTTNKSDDTETKPWVIDIDAINMQHSRALYAMSGYTPASGFDASYIALDSLDLAITDFHNRADSLRVPLTLTAHERSGVDINLAGTLSLNARAMTLDDLHLSTPRGTDLRADALLGLGDITAATNPLSLKLNGDVASGDITAFMPLAATYTRGLRPATLASADIDIAGTPRRLDINRLMLDIPRSARLEAAGTLANIFDTDKLSGDITTHGTIGDISPWRQILTTLLGGVNIPPMTFEGGLAFNNGNYDGDIEVHTTGGTIAATATLKGRGKDYTLALSADKFPIDAFVPEYSLGTITAEINASGHGFDPTHHNTTADISATIAEIVYNGKTLHNLTADITLADSKATADIISQNNAADFTLHATAFFDKTHYNIDTNLHANTLDLYSLGINDSPLLINGIITLNADFDSRHPTQHLAATLTAPRLSIIDSVGKLDLDNIKARINADSLTNINISDDDLYAYFSSPHPLDSILACGDKITSTLRRHFEARRINIEELQQALPDFSLDIDGGGGDNIVTRLLSHNDISLGKIAIVAINDSTLTLDARATAIRSGETRIDTLTFNIAQDGNRLNYAGRVRNRPGTFDEWAQIDVDGYFRPGRLGINFTQRNIRGVSGFDFGAYADLNPDSTATIHFMPLDPTIGYQQWLVNEDNFITYNFATGHIDGDLRMRSDYSTIDIFTEHADSDDVYAHNDDENLIVRLRDIRLQDWITLNPFAPAIKGNLSSDMSLNYHNSRLKADGTITLADFTYGGRRSGTFKADTHIDTSDDGHTHADIDLWVDGVKSVSLCGRLNDSTAMSPLALNMTMIHFPLSTLNPFVSSFATLQGTLNGNFDIAGTSATPRLNGSLQFDSAAIYIATLGSKLTIAPTPLICTDNDIRLSDFAINTLNNKPITINGNVLLHNLDNADINLNIRATQAQLLNSTRAARGADFYGKAFINLDATARGNLSQLNLNARATLAAPSNFTYIMPDATSTIQNQANNDMVQFVNFNDTTTTKKQDTPTAAMTTYIDAQLSIASGTTIAVDLSTDGKNKVQLQPSGNLTFTSMPMDEGRLTGRLTLGDGYARYTPPLMSEKLFNFDPESYIAFNGDILKPRLNIRATDHLRANVTQEGQNSRLIYFDIIADITGTLDNIDLALDLTTDDDITVANELQSMSQTQRASQAMNLLLYNTYTGPGTKAGSNLSGNPLYSFLTSRLNSWASGAIKGVDLSFGIDQYNRTDATGSHQTTSYSYRVSKTLANDRLKIAVGGNYSTDNNADVAQNLFNDVTLEYTLNRAGTMSIKIFRHTDYESILEGEITQTGIGFTYKRKIRRVSDIFRFGRKRKKTDNPTTDTLTPGDTPADTISSPEPAK